MTDSLLDDTIAPIALFVYNRPDHTIRTIAALKENDLAYRSHLIIFSDGPKNDVDVRNVDKVREIIKSTTGFKTVEVVSHEKNKGLAASIIYGVSNVINQHGRVIVIEDDIVTNASFLSFMNAALNFYEDKREVWHVTGWNYPMECEDIADVFLWRVMNCWGWATWSDRWENFSKNPTRLDQVWTKQQKRHFDLDGSGIFWSQVKANLSGRIDTWAIFWYATIHENNGLCVNPRRSFVNNIGYDGTGTHCADEPTKMITTGWEHDLDHYFNFPDELVECQNAVGAMKKYYRDNKLSLLQRATRKFRKVRSAGSFKNIIDKYFT